MASTDSLADNTAFAAKNEAGFPILADPDKTMTREYGVLMAGTFAKRWTFYIDDEGVVTKIDKNVNPRTAGRELLQNLIALDVPVK